ncbi:MAG: PDZ domain-containing protein [Myxococcota bacterium]
MSSQWRFLLGGALLGGGLVGALLRFSESPPDAIERSTAALPPASELQAELDRERSRADDLAKQLGEVEQEFSAWMVLEEPDSEGVAVQPDPEEEVVRPAPDLEDESGPSESSAEPWFDSESLLKLGVHAREVERIREAWEQYVMRKLRILNQKGRRGEEWAAAELSRWMWSNEMNARQELGDESYEAMLYAGGERNRVIFAELLESSPATAAGLLPGDELISYGDRRIFSPPEMKKSVVGVPLGEWVEIRVLRQGELQRFFVESGPIGARMEFKVRPPYEPR